MSNQDKVRIPVLKYVKGVGDLLVGSDLINAEDFDKRKHIVDMGMDCDLPYDGTYKWDGIREFIPLGYTRTKPTKPPISDDFAMYLVFKTVRENVESFPAEVNEWIEWYEDNMKQQMEEQLFLRQQKRKR